jgi:AraC-like DNA-binding protein
MREAEAWHTIYNKIWHTLAEKKLYRDQSVNLSTIALALGTNVSYVSKAINTCAQENFNTLLISLRVAEACELLKQDHQLTMEEIGVRCGFGSRASFYRGFKKLMGVSPKKYAASPERFSKVHLQYFKNVKRA